MRSVALFCHESTPTPFVRSLQVSLDDEDGRISLRYDLQGDIQRLRIPPPRTSARVDELWRHTCFEAFFKPADAAGYLELNFAPSSEWAAYEFNGYRAGMTPAAAIVAPTIACARSPSHLETLVSVNIPPSHRRRVRLALSAVIEDDEGCLSYWALAHPRGKPDFHHDDGFALGC